MLPAENKRTIMVTEIHQQRLQKEKNQGLQKDNNKTSGIKQIKIMVNSKKNYRKKTLSILRFRIRNEKDRKLQKDNIKDAEHKLMKTNYTFLIEYTWVGI